MSLTKNLKPKTFFSLQTWRLDESFEGLHSSSAQSPGKLCSWWDNWKLLDLGQIVPAVKVLNCF